MLFITNTLYNSLYTTTYCRSDMTWYGSYSKNRMTTDYIVGHLIIRNTRYGYYRNYTLKSIIK